MADAPEPPAGQRKRSRRTAKRRVRPRGPKQETALAIIDRLLLATVGIVLNGEEAKITALEAIMYQLLQKEMAGDARASRALLKFEELAKGCGEAGLAVEFIDNDYTRAFAQPRPEAGHG